MRHLLLQVSGSHTLAASAKVPTKAAVTGKWASDEETVQNHFSPIPNSDSDIEIVSPLKNKGKQRQTKPIPRKIPRTINRTKVQTFYYLSMLNANCKCLGYPVQPNYFEW